MNKDILYKMNNNEIFVLFQDGKNNLHCVLPENTIDILLKVCTRLGEHTFREDI